jgi:argininosuccinate lyase
LAGKLHTGRSRNDQVVTDFRLWIMDNIPELMKGLQNFQSIILKKAEESKQMIMPGYTHLRRAQPVLLSHWWLSHFWALNRDVDRLISLSVSIAIMPLGSGALAGTASLNSLDAVSDRDFAVEFLFWASLLGVHISRLAEALILFTGSEFGFFQLSDSFSTGSSLMPQKKNPDIFELARAKSAVFSGGLITLLTLLKGLPSAYDKDLQEDKQPVFMTMDILKLLLPTLTEAVNTLIANPEKMLLSVDDSLSATDLADYLVRKGVPFREAHHIAAQAVILSNKNNIPFNKLPLEILQSLHPAFERDVYDIFSPLASLKFRSSFGGTSPDSVQEQINLARNQLIIGKKQLQ